MNRRASNRTQRVTPKVFSHFGTKRVERSRIINIGWCRTRRIKPFVTAVTIHSQPNLGPQVAVLSEVLVSLPGAPLQ
jgi:hypothetical protein